MSPDLVLGLPDLTERHLAPELMDAPGLERARHLHALDALATVNALSGSAARVWREVVRLSARGVAPVRVLDVACGGGDVLRALARRAERRGVPVRLEGCDVSPVALERSRSLAGPLGVAFHELDVLREPLPRGYDVVCCSLFLHHLGRDEAVELLREMAAAVERVVLVQDLRRSRLGYLLARIVLGLVTRSDVARHDGPVSVGAALTLAEVDALAREAGLDGFELRRGWPQRLVLRWERPA